MQVTLNSNAYSDNGEAARDLRYGGVRLWWFPMSSDMLVEIARVEAAATSAVLAPGSNGTSVTSMTLEDGLQTFVTQPDKLWVVGQYVTIAVTASPRKEMGGVIESYDIVTGDMEVYVDPENVYDTGTYSAWTIGLGVRPVAASSLVATSTTSLTFTEGSKSLVIQASKSFHAGQYAVLVRAADPAAQMISFVDDYDNATGDLDITVLDIGTNTGTYTDWVVAVTGKPAGLTSGSSTSSLVTGLGSRSLTASTARAWEIGDHLCIAYVTDPTTQMIAIVTSYDQSTGALVVLSKFFLGTGTHASWTISDCPAPPLATSGTTTASMLVESPATKNFTTQTDLDWHPGQPLVIAYTTTPSNQMTGTITTYDRETGDTEADITDSAGSGTYTDWTVSIGGATGATGSSGSGGPGSLVLIATVSASNDWPSIVHTFTSTYKEYVIRMRNVVVDTADAPLKWIVGTVSSDYSNSYKYNLTYVDYSTDVPEIYYSTDTAVTLAVHLDTTAGYMFNGELRIFNPSSSSSEYPTFLSRGVGMAAGTTPFKVELGGVVLDISGIYGMQFKSSGNIVSGDFTLYGVTE